jgi:hypothetical protein
MFHSKLWVGYFASQLANVHYQGICGPMCSGRGLRGHHEDVHILCITLKPQAVSMVCFCQNICQVVEMERMMAVHLRECQVVVAPLEKYWTPLRAVLTTAKAF